MLIQFIKLALGFVILIKGADWLVDGASALGRKYKISDLAIGLTIVAFGTSMPEFFVNVFASYQSYSDIALGNVIGSNIFNLLAILGISGLISPLTVQSSTVWKEIPLSFFSALMLFLLANNVFSKNLILTRFDGIILLILFVYFLYYVFYQLKNENITIEINKKDLSKLKIWMFIVGGLLFLIFGGKLVVNSAVKIAISLGISEKIIGLTIVATGTSLPELATSVVAAIKKNNDIAVGNIIGSNIFNILFILGISSIIKPLRYDTAFNYDLYLLGIGTILLFIAMFTGKQKKLDRWEAGILLLLYIGYVIYSINKEIN